VQNAYNRPDWRYSGFSFSIPLSGLGLSRGLHYVQTKAFDNDGLSATSDIGFYIANRPTVTISADTNDLRVGQSTTIRANYSVDTYDGDSLTLTAINMVDGVEQTVNGYQSGNQSWVFTPKHSGIYTFKAYAQTRCAPSLNVYATCTVSVAEALPPTPPTNLRMASVAFQYAVVIWAPVPNASNYEIYIDGQYIGSTKENIYTIYSVYLGQSAEHTVTICAVDAIGRNSGPSSPLKLTPPPPQNNGPWCTAPTHTLYPWDPYTVDYGDCYYDHVELFKNDEWVFSGQWLGVAEYGYDLNWNSGINGYELGNYWQNGIQMRANFSDGPGVYEYTAVFYGNGSDMWDGETVKTVVNVAYPGVTMTVKGNTITTITSNESKSINVQNGTTLAFNFAINDVGGKYQSMYLTKSSTSDNNQEKIYESSELQSSCSCTLSSVETYFFQCYVVDTAGHKTPAAILEVISENRPPDIATLALDSDSIEYGQSVNVTGYLHDPDGNLSAHSLWVVPPAHDGSLNPSAVPDGSLDPSPDAIGRSLFSDCSDWWSGSCSETGWSGPQWNSGHPSGGTNSTVTGIFTPYRAGTWQIYTNGRDAAKAKGPGATKTLNVAKTTPKGTFQPQNSAIKEGTPLTQAELNATFSNTNNSNFPVTGSISYTVASGGTDLCPNGTTVTSGTILPAGTYTIRATVNGDANYNGASVSATITVNDNLDYVRFSEDGLTNRIKANLNLNLNAPAINDPDALDINIHTPTTNN